MIGPHGAGLMHCVFMPDRAALIELFVDGSAANRHFHNLALWSGHKYHGVPSGNPVDAGSLVALVKRVVSEMDLKAY
jgi:capsular polysaccharide biosynthesis protein